MTRGAAARADGAADLSLSGRNGASEKHYRNGC